MSRLTRSVVRFCEHVHSSDRVFRAVAIGFLLAALGLPGLHLVQPRRRHLHHRRGRHRQRAGRPPCRGRMRRGGLPDAGLDQARLGAARDLRPGLVGGRVGLVLLRGRSRPGDTVSLPGRRRLPALGAVRLRGRPRLHDHGEPAIGGPPRPCRRAADRRLAAFRELGGDPRGNLRRQLATRFSAGSSTSATRSPTSLSSRSRWSR